MKLSVLICTIPSRMTMGLIPEVCRQATKDVEVLWLGDNKSMSIGEKRNRLLSIATGDYVIFADDDDRVSSDFIQSLLAGIDKGCDVVVFKQVCSINGARGKEVFFDIRNKNKNFPDHYERQPHHGMCIKRDIASQVPYLDINYGEDSDFGERINGLLKSQAKINKVLYYYDYNQKTSEAKP